MYYYYKRSMARFLVKIRYKIAAFMYDFLKEVWNKQIAYKAEEDLANFLRKNLGNDKTILELGCGTGVNLEKIIALKGNFKSYIGVDFSRQMLNIARKKFQNYQNVEFRKEDITKLRTTKKFDVIICAWVLMHLDESFSFVNKIQQMLAGDGKFFIMIITKPKPSLHWFLTPLLKFIVGSPYIKEQEIQKFMNIKKISRYPTGVATILIQR